MHGATIEKALELLKNIEKASWRGLLLLREIRDLLVVSDFKSYDQSPNVQLVTYLGSWFMEQLGNLLSYWVQVLLVY
jgi:hypothetical protein